MNPESIICFGQQPCGFFPKQFLVAKINTARSLQKKINGKIVFFYHDSDADYRETITIFRDKYTNAEVRLNFTQENKIQKKFSPLYLKRVPLGWKEETLKQLPRFMDANLIDIFKSTDANTVADFCLEMYKKMGLLDGIEIVRSSDKTFRERANLFPSRPNPNASEDERRDPLSSKIPLIRDSSDALGMVIKQDWFADLPFQGEIVRAKIESLPHQSASTSASVRASLHEGGGKFIYFDLPDNIEKSQINPGKDERFDWMNSVIHCTHYIAGNSEYDYIKRDQFPEVKFIKREQIENSEMAWLD